ncbi:Phosphoglycolate phosphatase, HAD superfamily [Rhodovulum sp. ES.010]|uniref:HAD family hydrolase n=1 Tax=Rhodovulum sp. ES.010 TaxID=1882821 RepID=UPI000927B64D|nr:HAD family hydrolase [Rhodovulum sp. ES.010]SIO03311.1 Phosphoglycolate phosphatase, HAD superfamily [Rhodovulum sp. ES.010]
MPAAPLETFRNAEAVFWDFDGVIKESVRAKADAYVALFDRHPEALKARVRDHHNAHGGMSRYEKIPLYLGWAGLPVTEQSVGDMLDRFAGRVVDEVIAADWVPGVEPLLRGNRNRRPFFLVTGTPTDEIRAILDALSLADAFRDVRGAPEAKGAGVATCLAAHGLTPGRCTFIGDAGSDLEAAETHGLSFILRRTPENGPLQQAHDGPQTEDFSGWSERI